MEGSIKRAEKLIHATNSALAQMKHNLTFDNGKGQPVKLGHSQFSHIGKEKDAFSFHRDLNEFEKEFRSDAKEMLIKMDKILEPSRFVSSRFSAVQAARAREKMKEINRILTNRKSDLPQSSETEQSRQKLLSLINKEIVTPKSEQDTFGKSISGRNKTSFRDDLQANVDVGAKNKTVSVKNKVEKSRAAVDKPQEELKIKLLETQEIINRGFQTARQLSQRVDHMARVEAKKQERTPSSEKTAVSDLTSLKDLNGSRKSESSETIKSLYPSEKCFKCQQLKNKRRKEVKNAKEEKKIRGESLETIDIGQEKRNRLVNMKRRESKKIKNRSKLCLQRLPSVHIKGGLQMQRVHSLSLPADNEQKTIPKNNTSIKILSHESIELEKKINFIENIQKGQCSFEKNQREKVNFIECFNCGKVIKLQEMRVNPKEIDNLLLECDFNVFDPRIDEFVEKCKGAIKENKKGKEENEESSESKKCEKSRAFQHKKQEKRETIRMIDNNRNLKLQELSQRLTRRYRDEIDQLEDYQENLEKILKSLFQKIDDSRKWFNFDSDITPSFVHNQPEVEKKKQNLTISKPFLVCLRDELEEKADKAVETKKKEKSTETDERLDEKHFKRRQKRKKPEKKDYKIKCKTKTIELPIHNKFGLEEEKVKRPKETTSQSLKLIQNVLRNSEEASRKLSSMEVKSINMVYKEEAENKANDSDDYEDENEDDKEKFKYPNIYEKVIGSDTASVESLKTLCEDQVLNLQTKADNDYESDFERESPTFKNGNGVEADHKPEGLAEVQFVKKLSTISEIDTELSERSFSGEKIKEESGVESMGMPEHKQEFEKDIACTLKHKSDVLQATQVKATDVDQSPSTSFPGNSLDIVKSEILNVVSSKSVIDHQTPFKSKSDASAVKRISSKEVIASLREVLTTLKDQFPRIQSRDDKLTDNVETLKTENFLPKSKEAIIRSLKPVGDLSPDSCKQKVLENEVALLKSTKNKSSFLLIQSSPDSEESNSSKNNKFYNSKLNNLKLVGNNSLENEFSGGKRLSNNIQRDPDDLASRHDRLERSIRDDTILKNKSPIASPSSKMPFETAFKDGIQSSKVLEDKENCISEGEISDIVFNCDGGKEGSSLQSICELISEGISEVSLMDHS